MVLMREMCNVLIQQATGYISGGAIFELIEGEAIEEAIKMLKVCVTVNIEPPKNELASEATISCTTTTSRAADLGRAAVTADTCPCCSSPINLRVAAWQLANIFGRMKRSGEALILEIILCWAAVAADTCPHSPTFYFTAGVPKVTETLGRAKMQRLWHLLQL